MSSVVVIIANIFEAEPYQMSLVQRDHVIQHLTAYAPHPSFRDSVLPRTANACPTALIPLAFRKLRTSCRTCGHDQRWRSGMGMEAAGPLGAAVKSNRS